MPVPEPLFELALEDRYDFEIIEGTTFAKKVQFFDENDEPIDLVTDGPYTARMHIRHLLEDVLTVTELTTENSGIVIDLTPEVAVWLSMTAVQTADLASLTFPALYDLELVSASGVVTRVLAGAVTLRPEVTR